MKLPSWIAREGAKRLLIIPPVLLGVGLYAWLALGKSSPSRREPTEASRVLRIISVPEVDVVPRVLGHGTAEPSQVWRAIAEVKGRVVHVHERLAPGELIQFGEELLRIDPAEYELSVAQLEADIQQAEAQLAELDAQSQNYGASLAIEKKSLVLAEKELERFRAMKQRNAASDSEVDAKEREYLSQVQSIQNLENSIHLIPAERKSLQAALAVKQTNLQQAKIDLEKTKIVAPFHCRLGDLSIELGQFLAGGEMLFEAHSTAATEIETQVAPHDARRLIRSGDTVLLAEFNSPGQVREELQLDATVRLRSGNVTAQWEGRLERLREELDTQTRTLGIVVVVDEPYKKVIPGKRPALVRGMYCEVELRGKIRERSVVIPRASLHEGHVYVLDSDNRLRRRRVDVDFAQDNFVCLQSGIQSGERLVVSDPTPAIEGLLVEPIEDTDLLERLMEEASGEVEIE